jgi:hypothetical protein
MATSNSVSPIITPDRRRNPFPQARRATWRDGLGGMGVGRLRRREEAPRSWLARCAPARPRLSGRDPHQNPLASRQPLQRRPSPGDRAAPRPRSRRRPLGARSAHGNARRAHALGLRQMGREARHRLKERQAHHGQHLRLRGRRMALGLEGVGYGGEDRALAVHQRAVHVEDHEPRTHARSSNGSRPASRSRQPNSSHVRAMCSGSGAVRVRRPPVKGWVSASERACRCSLRLDLPAELRAPASPCSPARCRRTSRRPRSDAPRRPCGRAAGASDQ